MRTTSRGFEIDYQSFGQGTPAVVLISGLLQAAQDWIDRGYVEPLISTNRVVTIDPLGFGRSDKPDNVDAYDLDAQITDVVAVLDAVGVETAVVWGYSMGCVLATAFAKEHPERTSALIVGGNLVGLTPADRGNIFTEEAAALLEAEGVGGYTERNMQFLDATTRELFIRRNDPRAAAAAVRAMARRYAAEEEPLPTRTLNYVGTREPWYEVALAVAHSISVEFQGVRDADHSEAFRAVDVVVPMVLSFLANT
ncbi:MAG TPA: alpha/beta hydrolase [Candidatus Dormibacteraeota bacterium]|jgi:pimeloyl-ACP methyl ester carboxylesterase